MKVELTRFERRAARAAFGTIFPGKDRCSLPLGICDMDLDGYLDKTLSNVPFEPSVGLRLAIWIVALAPIFVLRRLVTIASLGVEDREKVLSAIYTSPYYAVRSAAIGLKAIGALLYCGDARVRPTLLAPAAPATSGPLVVLRKRTSPTDVSDTQEHRDEAHHFA